jgi:hypothetical protein
MDDRMSDALFTYDVFLSHSAMDKAVVRPLAEWLRGEGLKVWPVPPKHPGVGGFDQWVLKPGDGIPAKIEDRLEHFQSAFQPLALSLQPLPCAPIKGSLAQFLYTNWRPAGPEQEYGKLLETCRHADRLTPRLRHRRASPREY